MIIKSTQTNFKNISARSRKRIILASSIIEEEKRQVQVFRSPLFRDFSPKRLAQTNLIGANLANIDLGGANLIGANLTGADLKGANLIGTSFSYIDLTGANLTGANLTNANLIKANLKGANLTDADLTNTNLIKANLTDTNLQDANLQDANLQDADLQDADLKGANLRGADLSNTFLTGANLQDADLTDANLTNTRLRKANLTGANLRGADLTGANYNEFTCFPTSFSPEGKGLIHDPIIITASKLSSLAHKLTEVNLNGSKVTYFAANLLPQQITEKYDLVPINKIEEPSLSFTFGPLDMRDVQSLEEVDPNFLLSQFVSLGVSTNYDQMNISELESLVLEVGVSISCDQMNINDLKALLLTPLVRGPYYELREKK